MPLVLGIELEEELVELVAQPRRLGQRPLALGHEQFQHHGVVLGGDRRQGGRLTRHQQGHCPRVEAVALVAPAGAAAPAGRPARVDFVDFCPRFHQVLG
jgi:hypothetical protein